MRATTLHRPPSRLLKSLLALGVAVGPITAGSVLVPPAASAADPALPTLRVFSTDDRQVVFRRKNRPVFVELPLQVTPVGGTFDLRVQRPDYARPLAVTQVVHGEGGTRTDVPLPLTVDDLFGLEKFFRLTVTDPDGKVQRRNVTFCPNSWGQQRIDPEGADRPTFPDECWALPLALGSVWGIDAGWAVPAVRDGGVVLSGRNGRYTITVRVADKYRDLFGIADADATATTKFRLRKRHRDGHDHHARRGAPTTGTPAPGRLPATKVLAEPPAANLPDLRTLPAFDIGVRHRKGKDWLMFGANVWVAGNSLLDIEGFRRPGENVMDAYQYFYDGQEVVGRAPVGTLEFDLRDGHHHWHLQQFARYRLLGEDQAHIAKSRKQSFCIVPTDPVDLSFDGAERRPYQTGLDSACGSANALWIRETLPVGWGDTYYQSRAGQSFNITRLPNGTYYIAVEANPTGELFESDTTNNQTLREIRLKGKPGKRKVCVPAVFGIGEEGRC